jgi:ankyrin repeat protein
MRMMPKLTFACVCGLALAIAAGAAVDLRLVDALQEQNRPAAIALLRAGNVDVNVAQPDGATALHWATHFNDPEVADLLIRAGANPNAANDYGITPLFLACTNGSAVMIEKLLNAGANPNATRSNGETPLMVCAWTGNADAVRHLVARGADVNAKEKERGQTALMWALEQQHLGVVRVLIESGADVHSRSKSGFTPLLFATKHSDAEPVRLLLAAGANINEGTPLRNRPGGRRAAANDEFADVPDGITPLLMATASGHEDLALFLLERGADPNAADGTGATALHHAMLKGMALVGAVSTKLAVNAYVFRPNMVRLIRALLDRGAKPNARMLKDPRLPGNTPRFSLVGATPFFFATASGDLDVMRLLIEHGADPLAATVGNTTTLMVAAGLGNTEDPTEQRKKLALDATKLLVELGADVNAIGENRWTALHGAAYTGADSIVQFLVNKGADVDAKDAFGQTPYSIAAGQIGAGIVEFQKKPFGPHPNTANLLLQLGANPTYADVIKNAEGPAVVKVD